MSSWRKDVQANFSNRAELSETDLCREFGVTESERLPDFRSALELFRQEYGLAPGKLRTNDSLDVFAEFRPAAWWNWLFRRAEYEESISELEYRLARQRRKLGLQVAIEVKTVGDFVAAWLGLGVIS